MKALCLRNVGNYSPKEATPLPESLNIYNMLLRRRAGWSRDSSVGVTNGLDDAVFESRESQDIVPVAIRSIPATGVPPRLIFRKYQTYFPRVKRPGRGADNTSPSSAEVKNE